MNNWKLIKNLKKKYKGKQLFYKILVNKIDGVSIAYRSDLENDKTVYKIEMFFLNPKTSNPLDVSAIFEQHTFLKKQNLLEKVSKFKKKFAKGVKKAE